jgi:hypothetical protein
MVCVAGANQRVGAQTERRRDAGPVDRSSERWLPVDCHPLCSVRGYISRSQLLLSGQLLSVRQTQARA